MKNGFFALAIGFVATALVIDGCAGGGGETTLGPPRIIAIMPPQNSYPVGQIIGVKTETDCADCTVLFEDKEVPVAGYYTLTKPEDEGVPKTEALETTIGPGVVLPDIVTGCPKNNKIENGCVVFVRVVQKGLKSNQRAVLVVPAGSEEAAFAATATTPPSAPGEPVPQLTAPIPTPANAAPATGPTPSPTAPAGTESTPPPPPASPLAEGPVVVATPPPDTDDTEELPPDLPEPPSEDSPDPLPPPEGGPETFTLPPLTDPDIYRIPGPLPPPDGLDVVVSENDCGKGQIFDEKKGECTSSTGKATTDAVESPSVQDIRVTLTSDFSRRRKDYPLIHLSFCPTTDFTGSNCRLYILDTSRTADSVIFDGTRVRAQRSENTLRASPDNASAELSYPEGIAHLRLTAIRGAFNPPLWLENLLVEVVSSEDEDSYLPCYNEHGIKRILDVYGTTGSSFIDFTANCPR